MVARSGRLFSILAFSQPSQKKSRLFVGRSRLSGYRMQDTPKAVFERKTVKYFKEATVSEMLTTWLREGC